MGSQACFPDVPHGGYVAGWIPPGSRGIPGTITLWVACYCFWIRMLVRWFPDTKNERADTVVKDAVSGMDRFVSAT